MPRSAIALDRMHVTAKGNPLTLASVKHQAHPGARATVVMIAAASREQMMVDFKARYS
jgi:hypothetical protein